MKWKFSPQAFIQYWNKSYVDYYFGVKPQEANSKWEIYQGTPTINYGGLIEVSHFVKRWTFVINTGVKFYGKEVYSSPTVSKEKEFKVIATIMYKVF